MFTIASVILPVFLVIGAGYAIAWRGILSEAGFNGLMKFAQSVAIPCLLFRAISTLDLGQEFDWALLSSFYAGAIVSFAMGLLGARALFGRPWEDSIAIGFVALFSNSVLLGLPITELAYGTDALASNFAIISIHAPFCYCVGITVMEIVRARGTPARALPPKVLKAMFSNAIVIGVALGFVVNLGNIPQPEVLTDALDLLGRAALPTALFGLGGILWRYKPEGDALTIAYICALSLLLHPAITWGLAQAQSVPDDALRSAILTAAMAPGVNAYLFADMYGVARRVAASAVLIGTALTLVTASLWLLALP